METIGREISYAYDGLNRLTSATGGIGSSGVDWQTMLLTGLHINDAMFLFRSSKRFTP